MRNILVAEVISWAKTIVFAVVFALIINNFLIVNASVPSGSMEKTIMTGDRVVANRLSYVFSEPKRFDMIVFKFPDDNETLFVKRLIGLPGEKVEIRDGLVFIDDSEMPLEDSFVNGIPYGDSGPYFVPEDCYFMLGDNRNNSNDARSWNNKFVTKEQLLGKVILRYYPKPTIFNEKFE